MNEENVKITCHVKIISKPGKRAELLDELAVCAAASRNEPGCEYHEIIQSIANPDHITLIEKFSNYKAFQAHMETPEIRTFIDNRQSELVADIGNSLHITQVDCQGTRGSDIIEELSYKSEVIA